MKVHVHDMSEMGVCILCGDIISLNFSEHWLRVDELMTEHAMRKVCTPESPVLDVIMVMIS